MWTDSVRLSELFELLNCTSCVSRILANGYRSMFVGAINAQIANEQIAKSKRGSPSGETPQLAVSLHARLANPAVVLLVPRQFATRTWHCKWVTIHRTVFAVCTAARRRRIGRLVQRCGDRYDNQIIRWHYQAAVHFFLLLQFSSCKSKVSRNCRIVYCREFDCACTAVHAQHVQYYTNVSGVPQHTNGSTKQVIVYNNCAICSWQLSVIASCSGFLAFRSQHDTNNKSRSSRSRTWLAPQHGRFQMLERNLRTRLPNCITCTNHLHWLTFAPTSCLARCGVVYFALMRTLHRRPLQSVQLGDLHTNTEARSSIHVLVIRRKTMTHSRPKLIFNARRDATWVLIP